MSGGAGKIVEMCMHFCLHINVYFNISNILGYVLSREAVRRFVVDALNHSTGCRQDNGGSEDVEIGTKMNIIR